MVAKVEDVDAADRSDHTAATVRLSPAILDVARRAPGRPGAAQILPTQVEFHELTALWKSSDVRVVGIGMLPVADVGLGHHAHIRRRLVDRLDGPLAAGPVADEQTL